MSLEPVSDNKDFNEIVDVVAEAALAVHKSKEDGKVDAYDLVHLLPVVIKLPAAGAGAKEAFKGLDAEEVKAAAGKVLEAWGVAGVVTVYVEEGFKIVGNVLEIIESMQAIKQAKAA